MKITWYDKLIADLFVWRWTKIFEKSKECSIRFSVYVNEYALKHIAKEGNKKTEDKANSDVF